MWIFSIHVDVIKTLISDLASFLKLIKQYMHGLLIEKGQRKPFSKFNYLIWPVNQTYSSFYSVIIILQVSPWPDQNEIVMLLRISNTGLLSNQGDITPSLITSSGRCLNQCEILCSSQSYASLMKLWLIFNKLCCSQRYSNCKPMGPFSCRNMTIWECWWSQTEDKDQHLMSSWREFGTDKL